MFSNQHPSPYGHGNSNSWHRPPQNPQWQPKSPVREDTIRTGEVRIERKNFVFALKENPRGRLLRITEDIFGRYNSIIVPASGLREFKRLLDEIIKAADEIPASRQNAE